MIKKSRVKPRNIIEGYRRQDLRPVERTQDLRPFAGSKVSEEREEVNAIRSDLLDEIEKKKEETK